MRADQALVARGLAPSRSAAQRLIADGAVRLAQGPVLRKPAHPVSELDDLQVDDSDELRFVSRAGAKLEHALAYFGIDPEGREVLDLGQSTGGFTDCLLQRGAARVVGIEVGHGQLHERLRCDPRVICLEHTNLRSLDRQSLRAGLLRAHTVPSPFSMAVADLSFISLTKVLPAIDRLLEPQACVVLLIKPQFELGPSALDSKGIVKNESLARTALDLVGRAAGDLNWQVLGQTESAVRGTDGNLEFFLHARTGSGCSAHGS